MQKTAEAVAILFLCPAASRVSPHIAVFAGHTKLGVLDSRCIGSSKTLEVPGLWLIIEKIKYSLAKKEMKKERERIREIERERIDTIEVER